VTAVNGVYRYIADSALFVFASTSGIYNSVMMMMMMMIKMKAYLP